MENTDLKNKTTYTLVLIRHGQTAFNQQKMFCGWTDVDLTEQGIEEAKSAGQNLKKAGFTFDIAFCSVLSRAKKTLDIILEEMGVAGLPISYSWRLNERHYGALQGQKHADVAAVYGAEQVQRWRRSFSEKPPQLAVDDTRNPAFDPMYRDVDKKDLPLGESLEDTIKRVLPYWQNEIVPEIKSGKKVIVAASGNSLRGLVKYIDSVSDSDIVGLEIATGTPIVYELDGNLKPISKYYLMKDGTKQPIQLIKNS
jgi:2,3-bisphosphoglycerate-dependent phosphoglycerate mutase